jgi:2,3-dimethylmalate lyase
LDEALRRGERYARAGADALFIEAPTSVDEMARIGRTLGVPLLANMLEGGRTPLLPPTALEELGFRIIIYGISLLMHAVRARVKAFVSGQSMADYCGDIKIIEGDELGRHRRK